MARIITICSAIASAAAFAPSTSLMGSKLAAAARAPLASSLQMAAADMVGVSAPLGFFDPLGFSKGTAENLAHYRECELKHGRIAMMATLGALWSEVSHPFYPAVSSNPFKAFLEVPQESLAQIFVFIGFVEFLCAKIRQSPTYVAGDYMGASELNDDDDASWKTYQLKELNNGRLAMMGIMGMFAHAALTGQGPREMSEAMMS